MSNARECWDESFWLVWHSGEYKPCFQYAMTLLAIIVEIRSPVAQKGGIRAGFADPENLGINFDFGPRM